MKSRMLCVAVLATFLISSGAFADIVQQWGGDDPTDSHANASASGSNPSSYYDESGWQWKYTTESGRFNWSIETSAYAYAYVSVGTGWASATAVGDADASSSPGGSASTSAYADLDSTGEIEDDPDGDSDSGNDEWFNSYDGVYGEHVAVAGAGVEEGSSSIANCNASGGISISLN